MHSKVEKLSNDLNINLDELNLSDNDSGIDLDDDIFIDDEMDYSDNEDEDENCGFLAGHPLHETHIFKNIQSNQSCS